MPGIVGYVSGDVRDEQLLDRMIASVRHEEWYRTDRYVDPPFNIARVHLGIFNPQPQPVFNEDGSLCLFMEGKIYGYEEEKRRLEEKHRFAFHNDPEFCLHLYEEQGLSSLERLNGAFVLLICNLRQKKVILANDRYGLMRAYWAVHNGALLFAPEAKAVLQEGTFKRELNTEALVAYLAFGEFWGDRTLLKGVNILPPASVLTYGNDELSVSQYWRFTYQPDRSLSERESVEQVAEAFRTAVARRLKEPLRYGVSLSGGLDCRAVLAATEPEKRREMATYTYSPSYCDAIAIAKKVAERCGTRQQFMELTPELIIANAEQLVWLTDGRNHIEGGFFRPVHQLARNEMDVVFDGFVLDRTLGGSHLRKDLIEPKSKEELLSSVLRAMRLFGDDSLMRLLKPEYHDMVREVPSSVLKVEFDKLSHAEPSTTFDEFYVNTRVGYASSWHVLLRALVEVSFPAADNDLLDAIYKIPPEKRLNRRSHRQVTMMLSPELARITYQNAMMPASAPLFLWRFGKVCRYLAREQRGELAWKATGGRLRLHNNTDYVDHAGWLRENDSWKCYFRDMLLRDRSLSREYTDQSYVGYLMGAHEKGRIKASYGLMRLVTFEIFLRRFIA
jgi:asparagine synthase (glutamine-hydrolysing)